MGKKTSLGIDSFVEKVREELNQSKGDLPKLAQLLRNEKPRLTYRWLLAFSSYQIIDPSFSRVRLLGSYLGMKLTTAQGKHFNKENV